MIGGRAVELRRRNLMRRVVIICGLCGIALVVALARQTVSVAAQSASQAAPAASYNPPRTPWGDPDLQGIWPSTDMVGVPFERPDQFGTRLFLTEAEFKAREAQAE